MDPTTQLTDTESIVLDALAAVEPREVPFVGTVVDESGLSPEATRSALAGLVAKDLVVEDATETADAAAGDPGPRYRIRQRPA